MLRFVAERRQLRYPRYLYTYWPYLERHFADHIWWQLKKTTVYLHGNPLVLTWSSILFGSCDFHAKCTITTALNDGNTIGIISGIHGRLTSIEIAVHVHQQKGRSITNGRLTASVRDNTICARIFASIDIIRVRSIVFKIDDRRHVSVCVWRKRKNNTNKTEKKHF